VWVKREPQLTDWSKTVRFRDKPQGPNSICFVGFIFGGDPYTDEQFEAIREARGVEMAYSD